MTGDGAPDTGRLREEIADVAREWSYEQRHEELPRTPGEFADALLAGPLAPLLAEGERVRAALHLIDRDGCENLTRGRCSGPHSGRTRDARYGADQWCAPCIAADALAGPA